MSEFDGGAVHLICDTLYKEKIYDQKWFESVDFEAARYSIGKNGGMIAIVPNLSFARNPDILLFNSDLSFVNTVKLPGDEELLDFYMTPEDVLVCVTTRGSIYLLNQRGLILNKKKLEIKQLSFAAFWETGVFLVTSESEVYIIEDFVSLKTEKFASCNYQINIVVAVPPHYGTVIEEKEIEKNGQKKIVETEVKKCFAPALLASFTDCEDEQNYLVCFRRNKEPCCIPITFKYEQMVFSSDGTMLAVLASDPGVREVKYHILIFTDSYTTVDYDIQVDGIWVKNIFWVGSTIALIGIKEKEKKTVSNSKEKEMDENDESTKEKDFRVLVIGASNECNMWEFGGCIGVQEVDGVRIISRESVHMIRNVPDDIHDFIMQYNKLNELGKQKMCKGIKLFVDVNDSKINSTRDPLEEIGDDLDNALNCCLNVTKFLFDSDVKKVILDTIAMSKQSAKSFDCDDFMETIKMTRILKTLADHPLRMVITTAQLVNLRNDRLLVRLCNIYKHVYASKIAEYLGEKTDSISQHWATCLVMSQLEPEEIVRRIKENGSNIDYIELAQVCYSLYHDSMDKLALQKNSTYKDPSLERKEMEIKKKKKLGNLLLNEDPVKSRCVPLYIRNNEWDEAITAAVQSNDEALLIYVLKQAKQKGLDSIIQKTLALHNVALAAWIQINQSIDINLYINANRPREAVCEKFQFARRSQCPIEEVADLAKEVGDDFGTLVANNYKLVRDKGEQMNMFKGVPMDIIDKLIADGKESEAKAFAKKMKLDADDVTWRKVHYFLSHPTPKIANELINELNDEDLAVLLEMLYDKKLYRFVMQMKVAITDPLILERLESEGVLDLDKKIGKQ